MGYDEVEAFPLKHNGGGEYVPPVILEEGQKTKQYLAAIATTIGAFSIGTTLSWTSPALPVLSNSNATFLDEPLSDNEQAWVGSLIAIGAIIGSVPTGYIADSIGRKWTIVGMALPFILSWLLIIFGWNIWFIYVARVLAGFACGGFSVVTPMYVGEIAEVSIRGALGSYFEVLICIGVMFVFVVGAIVNYTWLAIIMCIPPVLSFIIFIFMPDTPVYHLKNGRKEEAERTLQYFRGVKYNIAPEIKMLQQEIDDAARNAGSWGDLISSRANINAITVSLGLMFSQQMSGVNIVMFYAADIFRAAGSDLHPDVCAVIVGTVQAFVTYISLLLVDRAGRRFLLFCSGIPSFCCLVILGIFFYLKENDPETAASISWVPLITINVFIIGMATGFGPIPWLVMGEIFSSKIKGPASSLACIINWFLVFFVTKTYVDFVSLVGKAGAFWFYAGCTGVGIVFIYFKVPETKGKSFLEIQSMLATGRRN